MKFLKLIGAIALWPFESYEYTVVTLKTFTSTRYNKKITPPIGFKCDGATWAPNLGLGWLYHDWMFKHGKFDDGTPITWRQANRIMLDIMELEGWPRWVRRQYRRGIKSKFSLKAWKGHRARTNGNSNK